MNQFRWIRKSIPVQWNPDQSRRIQPDCRSCRDCYTVHSQSPWVRWKYRTGRWVQASRSGSNRTTWFTQSLGVHWAPGYLDHFPFASSLCSVDPVCESEHHFVHISCPTVMERNSRKTWELSSDGFLIYISLNKFPFAHWEWKKSQKWYTALHEVELTVTHCFTEQTLQQFTSETKLNDISPFPHWTSI